MGGYYEKGNAGSIGADSIFEFAKAQEMAGREGRFEEIDENGIKLVFEYEEMLSNIRKFLENRESGIFILDDRR